MPVARCHFADGTRFEVRAERGEPFLDAALRAGVPLRFQCRSGSCLSCVCRSEHDGLRVRTGVSSSLLGNEIDAGRRLCCIGELESDDDLYFDYRSDSGGPASVRAFVDAVEWMAEDAVRLKVELAEGDWLDFQPGQYVRISPPDSGCARSYSMCSTAEALPKLEFMVRVLDRGHMSDYLRRARSDDVLTLTGPFGAFTWRGDRRAPHLFVAGGTGLSPIASIVEEIRAASGRKPPMILSFGCAHRDRLFARDYLERLSHWMPTLDLRISVEEGDATGLYRGNPLEAVDWNRIGGDTRAYLCGPPGLISAATARLVGAGVPRDQIYHEQFSASEDSEAQSPGG